MADPFAAFQMGVGLGQGNSTLGALVKTVIDRASKLQDLQAQSQLDIGTSLAKQRFLAPGELAQKKAEIALDPTKQFLESLLGGTGSLQERLAGIQNQLGPGQEITAGPLKVSSLQSTPEDIQKLKGMKLQAAEHATNIAAKTKPGRFFGLFPQPPTAADIAAVQSQYGGQEDDPVVQTGVETETGRRVGRTRSGKTIYLQQ